MPRTSHRFDARRPFVALDFETADHGPDSACAIGLVKVVDLEITERVSMLIRPPRERIAFTHIHHITWEMVKDSPSFAEAWAEIVPLLDGAAFLSAHNAGFDRNVLRHCCERAGLPMPRQPFHCTVQLARKTWRQPRNDLASVCRRLGIALNHHDALSDAEACARIVIESYRQQSFNFGETP